MSSKSRKVGTRIRRRSDVTARRDTVCQSPSLSPVAGPTRRLYAAGRLPHPVVQSRVGERPSSVSGPLWTKDGGSGCRQLERLGIKLTRCHPSCGWPCQADEPHRLSRRPVGGPSASLWHSSCLWPSDVESVTRGTEGEATGAGPAWLRAWYSPPRSGASATGAWSAWSASASMATSAGGSDVGGRDPRRRTCRRDVLRHGRGAAPRCRPGRDRADARGRERTT
jgi:hypothetical protein